MRHLAFSPDHLETAVFDAFAPMKFAIFAARNRRSKNEVARQSRNLVTRLIHLLAARGPPSRRRAIVPGRRMWLRLDPAAALRESAAVR